LFLQLGSNFIDIYLLRCYFFPCFRIVTIVDFARLSLPQTNTLTYFEITDHFPLVLLHHFCVLIKNINIILHFTNLQHIKHFNYFLQTFLFPFYLLLYFFFQIFLNRRDKQLKGSSLELWISFLIGSSNKTETLEIGLQKPVDMNVREGDKNTHKYRNFSGY
jgi:hypothetical protein